jgi:small subunit ribosomal protein S20
MANHTSAKKAIRQTLVRTLRNQSRISRIRTFVKKVEEAVRAGSHEEALKMFRMTESEMMKGVTRNLLHLNTAARRVSRLALMIKNMAS